MLASKDDSILLPFSILRELQTLTLSGAVVMFMIALYSGWFRALGDVRWLSEHRLHAPLSDDYVFDTHIDKILYSTLTDYELGLLSQASPFGIYLRPFRSLCVMYIRGEMLVGAIGLFLATAGIEVYIISVERVVYQTFGFILAGLGLYTFFASLLSPKVGPFSFRRYDLVGISEAAELPTGEEEGAPTSSAYKEDDWTRP